ncbi:hypothetical protein DI392_16825 [Vibrio albus]|uniref:histidine kinase n=1 Tax=Vibrio albus TaxID=2200953 RepID=A0A2U3B6D5_9VIBR|nr:ATP-binding protein [Vibrio albus]PWI32332.1 hypothetical protein DI392_16825 [Vibrio albus]
MISWYQKQKLIHQIGVIILIGFTVSFFLSLYLLSSEKSKNLSLLSSTGAIQRVISVVDILSQTPADLHDSIIRASGSSDLSLSLSRQPHIETGQSGSEEADVLIQRLHSAGIRRVHLSMVKFDRSILNMSDMHNAMMSGRSRHDIQDMRNVRLGYIATVDGSVELASGLWLNFSSGVEENITHWSIGVLISLSLVMLTTVFISLLIIRKALKPIGELRKAADQFAMNKKVSMVDPHGPKDLYPTIRAFNEMQTQLTDYIQDRTKLLAAISHDLRTPLTSLRLRLEFIEDSEDKQQMLHTLAIMEKMLQATMRFTREDSELEERQRCDVNSLIQAIVDEYADKNVIVRYQPQQSLVENMPPVSIRRMVENLVNNSVQYGGEGNTISLEVKREKQYLVVSVIDTGKGIAEDKFEEVVKPFTRLNQARDTESSNVGLGLSITASLAKAHGGELILQKNHPKGLIATFTLPLSINL